MRRSAIRRRGRRDDVVVRAATGLSGGGGLAGDGSCEAYSGASMFLGQMLGRDRDDFTDAAAACGTRRLV